MLDHFLNGMQVSEVILAVFDKRYKSSYMYPLIQVIKAKRENH